MRSSSCAWAASLGATDEIRRVDHDGLSLWHIAAAQEARKHMRKELRDVSFTEPCKAKFKMNLLLYQLVSMPNAAFQVFAFNPCTLNADQGNEGRLWRLSRRLVKRALRNVGDVELRSRQQKQHLARLLAFLLHSQIGH